MIQKPKAIEKRLIDPAFKRKLALKKKKNQECLDGSVG